MDKYSQIEILKNMHRIRAMDDLCADLYCKQKIQRFTPPRKGNEAVEAGVVSLLRPQDNISGNSREHIHALLKGVRTNSIFLELLTRTGFPSSRSVGGLQFYLNDKNFFKGTGTVVTGLPQAIGLAFAFKKSNEDHRTVCFVDDTEVEGNAFIQCLLINSRRCLSNHRNIDINDLT